MAITPCEHCGSVACAIQSPAVCRHTRRPRHPSSPPVALREVIAPPVDKTIRRADAETKRGGWPLGRKRNKG